MTRPIAFRFSRAVLQFAIALSGGLLALVSCGGGGGGGGSNSPQAVQVLLRDGDSLPGDFVVGTIEEANMAADRSVALIASGTGLPVQRGVFLRKPDGSIQAILSPATQVPEGVSLATLSGVTMASSGEFIFKTGSGLDSDTLFLFSGNQLSIIAQAGSQATPPGFRILGERQIAAGGRVAFTAGKSPCSVETTGGDPIVRCALEVFSGTAQGIAPVAVPNDLENQRPAAVSLLLSDQAQLVLALPASGTDPSLAEVRDGEFHGLISRGQSFPDLGTLSSISPRGLRANGDVLLDARVDVSGDGQADEERVLVYSGGALTTIARTGEPVGSDLVLDVRGQGVDDTGRVSFTAEIGRSGQGNARTSLRVWQAGSVTEAAFEGQQGFGEDDSGNKLEILEIGQIRVSPNGDLVFRATIGREEDGTRTVSETRIMRFSSAGPETLLKTGTDLVEGKIVTLTVSDLNDGGDLLAIGSLDVQADRAILLLPRS